MKILITGSQGYIAPVVAKHLKEIMPGVELTGWDIGYFDNCAASLTVPLNQLYTTQKRIDLRDVKPADLIGFDAVIQLAAISNDPIGNQFETVTNDVNVNTTATLAQLAAKSGVKRFVFASSCSMYGAGSNAPRKETDALNPLTAYARSKVAAEQALSGLARDDFKITALRFSTAYGMAPFLRLDLVINDFVASAVTTGKIEVLSDGSPWRPLIHVTDMARAIEWALIRDGAAYLAVNAGSPQSTWQMGKLAKDIANVLGDTEVFINTNAQPDLRSYQVDFSLFQKLAPDHQPVADFATAVLELKAHIQRLDFENKPFRDSRFIRLAWLRNLLNTQQLNQDLRWQQ